MRCWPMQPADAAPFEPTREAALARLQAVRPGDYARTRNHLEAAVTGLSPYLTHGLLSLPEVLAHLRQRHRIAQDHKLVFEWVAGTGSHKPYLFNAENVARYAPRD
jgi:deoxyribodipyrimidine photo-lyase